MAARKETLLLLGIFCLNYVLAVPNFQNDREHTNVLVGSNSTKKCYSLSSVTTMLQQTLMHLAENSQLIISSSGDEDDTISLDDDTASLDDDTTSLDDDTASLDDLINAMDNNDKERRTSSFYVDREPGRETKVGFKYELPSLDIPQCNGAFMKLLQIAHDAYMKLVKHPTCSPMTDERFNYYTPNSNRPDVEDQINKLNTEWDSDNEKDFNSQHSNPDVNYEINEVNMSNLHNSTYTFKIKPKYKGPNENIQLPNQYFDMSDAVNEKSKYERELFEKPRETHKTKHNPDKYYSFEGDDTLDVIHNIRPENKYVQNNKLMPPTPVDVNWNFIDNLYDKNVLEDNTYTNQQNQDEYISEIIENQKTKPNTINLVAPHKQNGNWLVNTQLDEHSLLHFNAGNDFNTQQILSSLLQLDEKGEINPKIIEIVHFLLKLNENSAPNDKIVQILIALLNPQVNNIEYSKKIDIILRLLKLNGNQKLPVEVYYQIIQVLGGLADANKSVDINKNKYQFDYSHQDEKLSTTEIKDNMLTQILKKNPHLLYKLLHNQQISMPNQMMRNNQSVIELVYLLKQSQPLVYHPYYYVKYKLPLPTFVAKVRQLLLNDPQLSLNPEKLYQELVKISPVVDVSPNLEKYSADAISKLIFKDGKLVTAQVLNNINENINMKKDMKQLQELNSDVELDDILEQASNVVNQQRYNKGNENSHIFGKPVFFNPSNLQKIRARPYLVSDGNKNKKHLQMETYWPYVHNHFRPRDHTGSVFLVPNYANQMPTSRYRVPNSGSEVFNSINTNQNSGYQARRPAMI